MKATKPFSVFPLSDEAKIALAKIQERIEKDKAGEPSPTITNHHHTTKTLPYERMTDGFYMWGGG
jgi:hypothetical protein